MIYNDELKSVITSLDNYNKYSLTNNDLNYGKPTVYILIGLPGSGKSTYAKSTGFPVFSSDEIRKEFDYKIPDNEVFNILQERLRECLKSGKNCIFDALNLGRKNRKVFIDSLKDIPCNKVCQFFVIPIEKCKERNSLREGIARVPDKVYDEKVRTFNLPTTYYDGFDDIEIFLEKDTHSLEPNAKVLYDMYANTDTEVGTLIKNSYNESKLMDIISRGCSSDLDFLLYSSTLYRNIGIIYDKIQNRDIDPSLNYGEQNYSAYLFLLDCLKTRGFITADMYKAADIINWNTAPDTVWKESKRRWIVDRKLLPRDIITCIDTLDRVKDLVKNNDISEYLNEKELER